MKTKIACAAGIWLSAGACYADVYVVTDSVGAKPIVVQKDDRALASVADIGGLPNEGFSYATRYVTTATGLRAHRGHVEPGGSIAAHEGPNACVLHVIQGEGKLVNTRPDGAETASINNSRTTSSSSKRERIATGRTATLRSTS